MIQKSITYLSISIKIVIKLVNDFKLQRPEGTINVYDNCIRTFGRRWQKINISRNIKY